MTQKVCCSCLRPAQCLSVFGPGGVYAGSAEHAPKKCELFARTPSNILFSVEKVEGKCRRGQAEFLRPLGHTKRAAIWAANPVPKEIRRSYPIKCHIPSFEHIYLDLISQSHVRGKICPWENMARPGQRFGLRGVQPGYFRQRG